MKHVDLFTGIGGFTLAAEWCGLETVSFCESDERCQAFLRKAWRGIPIHPDVGTFDGSPYRGAFLLTGGVPCQPASRAGKQKGASDDRWLWPEAIRVLSDVRPTWTLFENPPGIGDVGLAGILAEMESLGYQVRVFGVPACAVGAPHRRERYWIVAHRGGTASERGAGGLPAEEAGIGGAGEQHGNMPVGLEHGSQGDVADASGTRRDGAAGEEQHNERQSLLPARPSDGRNCLADTCSTERRTGNDRPDEPRGAQPELARGGFWDNAIWLPCADGKLRRAPDDSQRMAHGLPMELLEELAEEAQEEIERLGPVFADTRLTGLSPHRSILGALGNSIVPQVAYQIIKAMIESEEE